MIWNQVTETHSWVLDVFWPFLLTRLGLLAIGWGSGFIALSEFAPGGGLNFTSFRLLDIWGRWDSAWYFSIIKSGYPVINHLGQSNTAFFPLYPFLVRALHSLFVPASLRSDGTTLLVGVLISNLAFLAALTLLFLLIRDKWGDRRLARRSVFYLCIFPTSYVFSSFYTESLFLFLTVAAFYAAEKGRWWLAGLAGGLSAFARVMGLWCIIPLGLVYWKQKRKPEWNVLSLAAIPAGLALFMLLLYQTTGDPLAFVRAQQGWNHGIDWPWRALLSPTSPYMQPVDALTTVLFSGLSLISFRLGAAYGIWAVLNTLIVFIASGTTGSMTRFVSVAFPTFVVLAQMMRRYPRLHDALVVASSMLLSFFMALWSQHYWVQ